MASPTTSAINCIDPNLNLDVFLGFKNIMIGFFDFIPGLIKPKFVADFAIKGPKAVIELFLKSLEGLEIPSFSFSFLGSKINFKGIDINAKFPGLEFQVFDPSGLIKFITNLLDIALGIPGLFFDLDKKPPVALPKLPTIDAILDLVKISLDPQLSIDFPDFPGKFAGCIAQALTAPLGL